MRIALALLVVAACTGKGKDKAPPSGGAPGSGATVARAETITPETPSLLRIGAPGASVHAEQLAGRDDGGTILVTELFGKMELGGRTIEREEHSVSTVIAVAADGKVRWARPLAGHCHLLATPHGTSTLVAGSCSAPIATETGKLAPPKLDDHLHVFVAMLDDAGAIAWSHYVGNAGTQVVYGAAVDAAGNAIVVGDFRGSIDFGTGLWKSPERDAFVVSYDPAGAPRWAKTYTRAEVQDVVAAGDELDIVGIFTEKTSIGPIALETPKGGRFFARLGADGAPKAAFLVGTGASMTQRLVRASTGTLFVSADTLEGVKLFAITDQAKELSTIKGKHFCLNTDRYLAIDARDTLWLETCVPDKVDLGDGPITGDAANSDVVVARFDATGKCLGHVVLASALLDTPGGLAVAKDGSVLAAWFSQLGPPDRSPHDWLITEVYYSVAIQKIVL